MTDQAPDLDSDSPAPTAIHLSHPTLHSLFIEMLWGDDLNVGATGTGFTARHRDQLYLITNYHNVSGRNPRTNEFHSSKGEPDAIRVSFPALGRSFGFDDATTPIEPVVEQLYEEGLPRWLEHGSILSADVVALPISPPPGTEVLSYRLDEPEEKLSMAPADRVSVVGFPYGHSVQGLAIWTQGSIASEPMSSAGSMAQYSRFLVDARTRTGQSGSPVIAFRNAGEPVTRIKDGRRSVDWAREPISELLGIYCGRVVDQSMPVDGGPKPGGESDAGDQELSLDQRFERSQRQFTAQIKSLESRLEQKLGSDLGIVWKTWVIKEIVESGTRRTARDRVRLYADRSQD
ncbi:trypsin-like peptidase domain-containing protein [Rhodococcus oryzae]|uniref:trypsin-like peptidase domain-containing protein n=1 Tax=Rhodococcus oryzae TaxID=2571143 RepID=UPI0037142025